MKFFFLPFARLAAVAACALTLGSCNRAEYAMLPKGGSYHGVTRAATPVPTARPEKVSAAATPATDAVQAPETVAAAPAAAPMPAAKATSAATTEAKKGEVSEKATPATAALGTEATAATPAPKLNMLQRAALNKAARKLNKLTQSSSAMRKHDNTASTSKTSAISGNLRIGIVLLLIGLLISIFSGLIGTIVALLGVIFIVLWLLDNL